MKQTLLSLAFLFFGAVSAFSQATRSLEKPDLAIYPNPATEFISVNDEAEIVGQLFVYNLVGKKVRTFEVTPDERFSVGDLPRGMYLVQLVSKDNKIINTQKINKK